jgi:dienelactone hydrolase
MFSRFRPRRGGTTGAVLRRMNVAIPLRGLDLPGELSVPAGARGLAIFAHDTGSNRANPRDEDVARALEQRGIATLRFDLVTPAEQTIDDAAAELHDDAGFLADRLIDATDWARTLPALSGLPIVYVGAGTGAAAARIAADRRAEIVCAAVPQSARVDEIAGLVAEWARAHASPQGMTRRAEGDPVC